MSSGCSSELKLFILFRFQFVKTREVQRSVFRLLFFVHWLTFRDLEERFAPSSLNALGGTRGCRAICRFKISKYITEGQRNNQITTLLIFYKHIMERLVCVNKSSNFNPSNHKLAFLVTYMQTYVKKTLPKMF